MAIKEIIEKEQVMYQSGTVGELNFYKDGLFWRAYEWSAYQFVVLLKSLTPVKRQYKELGEAIYVGFPETSVPKYMPEGGKKEVVDESHFVLHLPDEMKNHFLDKLAGGFPQWKESIPLQDKKEKGQKKTDTIGFPQSSDKQITSFLSILQRIIAFPLENKSPLECLIFLGELKKDLSKLI